MVVSVSVYAGGKEEDEQCRSKRHRSGLSLLFFFFFIYIYETTSFWIKRAVSFKWVKLQISPSD